jgi:hypothetical protein
LGTVHHVFDLEIDRHAADDVRLLSREPALLEEGDHVEHGVAAGQVEIAVRVGPLVIDGHAHGGDESLGDGPPGIDEVVAALEPRPANAPPLGLAPLESEAHHARRAHLDRRQADFAVALGEVGVAHPTEAAGIAARTMKWDPQAVLAAHRLSSPLFPKDGSIDTGALRTMQDTLLEQGVLTHRLPLEEHYTTAFTPVRL